MATRHIAQLIDDLDGAALEEGAGKQITFSIEGRSYEIDLSQSNADKLYSALAPFIDAARSVGSTARSSNPRGSRARTDIDLGAVRDWARANGHAVSDRGRVPGSIIDAYKAAV